MPALIPWLMILGGLFWSQNNMYLWNSRSNRRKWRNLFWGHTLDWVVLCTRRQPFGLVCWSVMVCSSLVLSNHSLVFLVLPIAVYNVLWLEKMKHCVYLLSSKRGHGREEETLTSLRTHPGHALVLGRETVDCDNQGQGVVNPEVLKISRFLNGLVHLCLFQPQLLMIM